MSYEHGTTHYNLPQTEGSDTRDWFDSNEAFRAIDEALYSANQTAGQATQDIEEVKGDINDLKDADTAITGRVNGIEGRVAANELKIGRLETDVTDGIQDLKDSICAIEEASATAAYAHATGEFFWYNDTLYKATTNIAIGQQIVPDTNCKTTNITTELLTAGESAVQIDDTVTSATRVWSSYKVNSELEAAATPKTGQTRYNSGKLQYYDGSAWVDAEIGGTMPTLDYTNPLHSFTTGNLTYTATGDAYVIGKLPDAAVDIDVNSTIVGGNIHHGNSGGSSGGAYNLLMSQPLFKISAGDVITVNAVSPNLYVLAEK